MSDEINAKFKYIQMPSSKSVKYLGLRLDTKMTCTNKIQYAVTKSSKIIAQLSRLMTDIGGPIPSKRKLFIEACNSIILYGSEIWAHTLKTKRKA